MHTIQNHHGKRMNFEEFKEAQTLQFQCNSHGESRNQL
jgi:hypothetical protein